MPSEIEPLVRGQWSHSLDVIATHHHLAKIVRQRGHSQRKAIMTAEMKNARNGFCNNGDSICVRVVIAFKFIAARGKTQEYLFERSLIVFRSYTCWHRSYRSRFIRIELVRFMIVFAGPPATRARLCVLDRCSRRV